MELFIKNLIGYSLQKTSMKTVEKTLNMLLLQFRAWNYWNRRKFCNYRLNSVTYFHLGCLHCFFVINSFFTFWVCISIHQYSMICLLNNLFAFILMRTYYYYFSANLHCVNTPFTISFCWDILTVWSSGRQEWLLENSAVGFHRKIHNLVSCYFTHEKW